MTRVLSGLQPLWHGASIPPPCKEVGQPPHIEVQYDTTGHSCCSRWHIPPSRYEDFQSTRLTFVVIRDPVERVLSEYAFREEGDCTEIDTKIYKRLLSLTSANNHTRDCHWLQQSEYFMKNGNIPSNVVVMCFESLAEDMAALFPDLPRMTTHSNKRDKGKEKCALNATTIDAVRKYYAQDLRLHNARCRSSSLA